VETTYDPGVLGHTKAVAWLGSPISDGGPSCRTRIVKSARSAFAQCLRRQSDVVPTAVRYFTIGLLARVVNDMSWLPVDDPGPVLKA